MRKGIKHTEEAKRKISKSCKGIRPTEETRNKMSETHKKNRKYYFHKPDCKCFACTGVAWNKCIPGNHGNGFKEGHQIRVGMKHTKETKLRISKTKKGCEPWNKGTEGLQALENHPSWKGGISFEPYGLDFNRKFKRKIRERDGCCMMCGVGFEYLKLISRNVCVHHIDYIKINNFPQNCLCLCIPCHTTTNYNRPHWTKFFQSLLKERYDYEYTEDQKIVFDFMKTY